MKRKPLLIFEICKIILNCLFVPMYFIKIYHEVAVIPGIDENGEEILGRFDHYYSVYDKFSRENILFLLLGSAVLIIASVTLAVCSIAIKNNKDLAVASHVIFGISAGVFLLLLTVGACIINCH